MKEIMLNKFNHYSESFKSSIGLVGLTIIIFITFFILNIFYGPDKNAEKKIAEQKVIFHSKVQIAEKS